MAAEYLWLFLCYVLAWSIKRKLTFNIWLSIFRWVKRNLSITIILSIGRQVWQSRYMQEEALIEQFRGGRFMTISSLSAKSFKGVSSLSIGNRSPQSVKTWNILGVRRSKSVFSLLIAYNFIPVCYDYLRDVLTLLWKQKFTVCKIMKFLGVRRG